MDYIEFVNDISLNVGDSRMCTTVIIVEDSQPEMDETFVISHVGADVVTQVIILNDDGNFTTQPVAIMIPPPIKPVSFILASFK